MAFESIDLVLKRPEGKQLEFKRDLSSPQPLLKTLVAFANTAGGQLFIGISDDGAIVGVEDPLGEEERLGNLIADSISPRLLPSIELLTVEGKSWGPPRVCPNRVLRKSPIDCGLLYRRINGTQFTRPPLTS